MSISWEESYVGVLRKQVGNQKLIIPSVRAIIQNEHGHILFINRRGENRWGMPAGSIELEESITDCLKREVQEETGLEVIHATLIAIYTNPALSTKNSFEDEYQMFEFLFRVDEWKGTLLTETDESIACDFFPAHALPLGSSDFWNKHHQVVCQDLLDYSGKIILK